MKKPVESKPEDKGVIATIKKIVRKARKDKKYK